MTNKQIIINKMDKPKRYCEGIDCAWCDEKEPCIYKIANDLEEKLLRKEQECKGLIKRISKIFACLIKANRTNKIVDTLCVDNITTLWDYIAQTLGIEGDQVQIEKQILQKISEVENEN